MSAAMFCQHCLILTVSLLLLLQGLLPYAVRAQDYQLEVLLRSYRNPYNQRNSGHCCEPQHQYPSCDGQGGGCTSKCDPYIKLSATHSTVNYTTPAYIDTDHINFQSGSVFMFYGEGSLWLNEQLIFNVVVIDYSENLLHHSILESSFSIMPHEHPQPAEICLFHNMTMRNDFSGCNGFVELNISYRLMEISSSYYCQDTCLANQVIGVETCNAHKLCGNNGHCQENGSGYYTCQCDVGYSGVHCEHIDYCVVYSPCQNAGNCSMIQTESSNVDWYMCTCSENWTGENCDVQEDYLPAVSTITQTCISNDVTSVYITVPTTCTATSKPLTVTSTVTSTSQPEILATSHTSSYYCIDTTSTSQSYNTPDHLKVVYSSLFIGGLLAGVILAGIIFLSFVIYLKMKARKMAFKTRAHSRRERNPFYQSAENLVRGVPTDTPQQYTDSPANNNDGYDTLRNLPLGCGSGKLLPLHKKENGFFYCLSPTDQPSPLRSLSSRPREQSPQYAMITSKLQGQSHNLMLEHRAQKTTKFTSTDPSCPYKKDPIYERADLHVYQNDNHLLRAAAAEIPSTELPALPQRRNQIQETVGIQRGSAIETEQHFISMKQEQHLIITREIESREEVEEKEKSIEVTSNDINSDNGAVSADVEALYTKVVKKKSKKGGHSTKTVSEKYDVDSSSECVNDDDVPTIPPYCGTREDEEEEEGEEMRLNCYGANVTDHHHGEQERRPTTLSIF